MDASEGLRMLNRYELDTAYHQGYADGLANAPTTHGLYWTWIIVCAIIVVGLFAAAWTVRLSLYFPMRAQRDLWRERAQRNTTLLSDAQTERDQYAVAYYRATGPSARATRAARTFVRVLRKGDR